MCFWKLLIYVVNYILSISMYTYITVKLKCYVSVYIYNVFLLVFCTLSFAFSHKWNSNAFKFHKYIFIFKCFVKDLHIKLWNGRIVFSTATHQNIKPFSLLNSNFKMKIENKKKFEVEHLPLLEYLVAVKSFM